MSDHISPHSLTCLHPLSPGPTYFEIPLVCLPKVVQEGQREHPLNPSAVPTPHLACGIQSPLFVPMNGCMDSICYILGIWSLLNWCLLRSCFLLFPSSLIKRRFEREKGKGIIDSIWGLFASLSPSHTLWKWCDCNYHCASSATLKWVGNTKKENAWAKTSIDCQDTVPSGYWLNNMLACRQIVKLKIIQRVPLRYPSHLQRRNITISNSETLLHLSNHA